MTNEAQITVQQSTLEILEEIRRQMEDYDGVINRLIDCHITQMFGPNPLWKLFNIEDVV